LMLAARVMPQSPYARERCKTWRMRSDLAA
jgi:hypothetical protein